MSPQDTRVPDLLVELYALGELSDEQAAEVERLLAEEEGGEERLAALRESNDEILNDYPVGVMSRRIERMAEIEAIERRSEPYRRAPRRLALAAAAFLLVGASIAFVIASGDRGPEEATPESMQGGVPLMERVDGDSETSPEGDEVDPYDVRNARAKKLKSKLERGREVSEKDDEATGLILAMERRANQALLDGDRREVVETCEAAREISAAACPWLDEALAKLDGEPVGESGDTDSGAP